MVPDLTDSPHPVARAPEESAAVRAGEPLEVSFRLTAADVRKSYFPVLVRHPRHKLSALAYCIIFPIALGVIFGVIEGPLFGLAVAVAAGLFFRLWLPQELGRRAMRAPGGKAQHTVRVSAENIESRTEGIGDLRLEWSFIEEVTDSPDFVAFHQKTGHTSIVPQRAFPTPEAASRFAQAAKAYHAAATRPGRITGGEVTPAAGQEPEANAERAAEGG